MLDCDAQGRLTVEGFLELYHSQTSARAADTWADLAALGYDKQLQLLVPASMAGEGAGGAAAAAPDAAAAGGAGADAGVAAPAAPAMDAALAACLPLVRAAQASGGEGAEVEAALCALSAYAAGREDGGGALVERLTRELRDLQRAGVPADAAPAAAADA
jgi:hypothetical protein